LHNLSFQVKTAQRTVADKGYDSDAIRSLIEKAGSKPVIPTRSYRVKTFPLNKSAYRRRNVVERLIRNMKDFRRFATRYDKLAGSFMAFTMIIASFITLKKFVNTP
jgi:transposase